MPSVTFAEMRRIAENLGHRNLTVVPMRPSQGIQWYRGECGCGYRTTRRTSSALAASALIHHLEQIANEAVQRQRVDVA